VPSARERFGSFADTFERSAAGSFDGEWLALDLREEPTLPEPEQISGVIVSGSASHVAEDLPWMRRATAYLSHLRAAEVPTLGICFGHQLLALATGGRVVRNPAGRELGSMRMEMLSANPLFDAEGEVLVQCSHLDSVRDLPAAVTTLGRTPLEPNALVHFGARSWGVQFHPEFDREITSCYVNERREVLRAEGLDPEAMLAALEESPEARRVIPNFLGRLVMAE
jgi:GMP synthase (glutamine-hydrolysing)